MKLILASYNVKGSPGWANLIILANSLFLPFFDCIRIALMATFLRKKLFVLPGSDK
jgi:hypothetical protein